MRALLAAIALLAITVVACGPATQPQAQGTSPTPVPLPEPAPVPGTGVTAPTSTPTASAPASPSPTEDPGGTEPAVTDGAEQVQVYYVRDAAGRLWVEPVTVMLDEPTVAVATAAMEALFSGEGAYPGLSAPATAEVLSVSLADGLLTVDVSEDIRSGGGSAAEEALAQALAYTGAQFDTVNAVRLWVEGQPITELWGHLDWSEPVEPEPFALSPIDVEQPRWGGSVPAGPITAAGSSNTFEATMTLRLIDPSGMVVDEATVTASCGSGCRGSWEHTFDTEADTVGTWTLEAEEPDPSGGEGRPPFITTVEFEVTS